MSSDQQVNTDILVIGGGIGGIFAAIKAKEQGKNVVIVEKAKVGKAGVSLFAAAGFEVYDPEINDFNKLMNWVVRAGEYLNNRDWIEIVMKDSYARYNDLVSWGVPFVEGEHKPKVDASNIAHIPKEEIEKWGIPPYWVMMTHKKWIAHLRQKVLEFGIKIIDRVMVTDLLKQDDRVCGAAGFHTRDGGLLIFHAEAVIIATGSGNFKAPGEPWHQWTADGEAMSYRAGAVISGKEFGHKDVGALRDFPTVPGTVARAHSPGVYINAKGDEFLKEYPVGLHGTMLKTFFEVHAGNAPIYFNFDRLAPEERKIATDCLEVWQKTDEASKAGLDYATISGKKQIIHGSGVGCTGWGWGGVLVNTNCETNIPGLYAIGDSAGTSYCGSMMTLAAGSGLTLAAVMGSIAAEKASEYSTKNRHLKPVQITPKEVESLGEVIYGPLNRMGGFSPGYVTEILRNIMVPYFIMQIKHGDRLQAALTIVHFIKDHLVPMLKADDTHELRMAHEARNMTLDAEIVLKSSIFRTESRGTHYREDYPRRDDPEWLAWTRIKQENGEMKVYKEPIPKNWWPDLMEPYEKRYELRFPGE